MRVSSPVFFIEQVMDLEPPAAVAAREREVEDDREVELSSRVGGRRDW